VRKSRSNKLAIVLLLASHVGAQTPESRASKTSPVEGNVTNAISHEPIPNVRVVFETPRNPADRDSTGKAFGAISGPDGHFTVPAVDPGGYTINASAAGFIGLQGTPFKVRNGEPVHDLAVALYPEATISGRVLDEHGDPAERMKVEIIGINPYPVAQATTDDRGEFRMRGLPGGRYPLRAVPKTERNTGAPEIRSDGTKEEAYQPTFYSASTTKEGATRVEARPGSNTGGIEIHLVRMAIMRVSGTISGIPQGTQSASVILWGRGQTQPNYLGFRGGEFAIWRLPPGHYSVQANAKAPDGTELVSLPKEIDLVSNHVDGILLEVSPPFAVSGRIEWHGSPPDQGTQEPMTIRLQGGVSGAFRASGGEKIAADSTFTIPKAFAGNYRVAMTGLPRSAFVRSVQVDSVEFPRENATLLSAPRQMIVTLSNSGAQISGTVENGKGQVPNFGVMLQEEGMPQRSVQTDANGHYLFRGIPPGKYKLMAGFPNIDGSDESRGESIEVGEGDSLTRNLRVPTVP
jgi:hypothetical protein